MSRTLPKVPRRHRLQQRRRHPAGHHPPSIPAERLRHLHFRSNRRDPRCHLPIVSEVSGRWDRSRPLLRSQSSRLNLPCHPPIVSEASGKWRPTPALTVMIRPSEPLVLCQQSVPGLEVFDRPRVSVASNNPTAPDQANPRYQISILMQMMAAK